MHMRSCVRICAGQRANINATQANNTTHAAHASSTVQRSPTHARTHTQLARSARKQRTQHAAPQRNTHKSTHESTHESTHTGTHALTYA